MSEPRLVLCTLALNEIEHLPRLYAQHRDWPGLVRWVFVEAADAVYAAVNPGRVTPAGLSTDGTSAFLSDLAARDERVTYIPHGLSAHRDPAQGKCAARQRYLDAANADRPDFLAVVDADEFYPREMQGRINEILTTTVNAWGWCFRHREIWHPPTTDGPPFASEVTGGFWDIPYCRFWRWFPGLEYRDNHNTPSRPRYGALDRRLARYDSDDAMPYMVHMAFASRLASRQAKHRYYETRGESADRKRKWYTESRAAWETWRPGDELPNGAKVIPYTGTIPECFTDPR